MYNWEVTWITIISTAGRRSHTVRPEPPDVRQLFRAFIDIALWRKGPQHLPYSVLLFVVTLVAYFAMSVAISGAFDRLTPDPDPAPGASGNVDPSVFASTCIGLAVTLAWIGLMLLVVKRSPRFYQTATAVLGAGIVIEPIVVLLPALLVRLGAATVAGILVPVMLAWYVVAIAHIIRSALDIRLLGAVLLTGGYVLCQYVITLQLMSPGS
jgi:hypothetical protein